MTGPFTRLIRLGWLLREVRGVRRELARCADAQEQTLKVLQAFYAQSYPVRVQADPTVPPVDITFVNEQDQRDFMEAELRLTAATGRPPTEEEIVAEFDRLRGVAASPDPGPVG